SLKQRECEVAIVGGVHVLQSADAFIYMSKLGALSTDGRCKTFDASANGTARGEGCGMVVLKRLSEALSSGDRIWAVIRGTAVNQDGATSGLTAPSALAQERVVRAALEAARVSPERVTYVEAHGTGTQLGDPIEVHALNAVYGARPAGSVCAIGSVKT